MLRQKIIADAANELHNMDKDLKRCRHYTTENDYSIFFVFVVNFVICGGVNSIEIFLRIDMTMVLWAIPSIVCSWVLIQYTLFLNTIIQRFKTINRTLLKFGNIDTENEFNAIFVQKIMIHELVSTDIAYISYANMRLCEICNKVSDFYAFPALIAVTYFMSASTFTVYFLILTFIKSKFEDSFLVNIDCASSLLMSLFGLVTLTTYVTRITREFGKTATCIHSLLDRCTTLAVKNALITFSDDLLHRNIKFDSYGIIVLDGFLLQSIFGTIVTYLIILIQFRSK
ncbi:uncharacterized protein LOC130673381 [Microplitis mediator]|uniref:uncharacterized protein LOC130673381 n=1 Tax=Microplitis mediator TaxID=375433 RepID=UPI002552E4FA|nr:uncharacterized protein LOC130673381 [Microplitis mediator]